MEIRSVDGFLGYLTRVRERTERVVGLVPDRRFGWRPEPGAFSFADLLRHVAALERYMFAENVRGQPSRYPGHGPDLAEGPEQVSAFWRRCRGGRRGAGTVSRRDACLRRRPFPRRGPATPEGSPRRQRDV